MAITATERNNALKAVNDARAKWGLGNSGSNISAGAGATASDVNNIISLMNAAKTASGYTGSTQGNVAVGGIIKNVMTTISSNANSIRNHCPCHGNCTGSCTSTCTGSCTGGCSGSCTSCQGCSGGCVSCKGCKGTCVGGDEYTDRGR